jgi:peptide/nickel transport system permease protein
MWRAFVRDRTAVGGLVLSITILVAAIAAPVLAPVDPLEHRLSTRLAPPGPAHLLGSDGYGRDVYSRILWGGRVSLLVGFGSILLAFLLGVPTGILAGYTGGRTDALLMRVVDVFMSFPTLIQGLVFVAVLGPGIDRLVIAIAIAVAPQFARLARGPTLAIREREFVEAARALGASETRIMARHILPNIAGEIMVMASLWVATAIRIEANLSFIGLGGAADVPTWGNMIREGLQYLGTAPWLAVYPGVAVLLTVLAFNMMGDGFRDAMDPRLRT